MSREHWTWEMFVKSGVWKQFFLNSITARWSQAESTVKGIVKVFAENKIESGKILDICCGNGRLAIWLAKQGFNVIGVDISAEYLEDARQRAKDFGVESKVTFMEGDMRDVDRIVVNEMPFDGVINFSTSIGFWDDQTDELIFTKTRQLTREDGILIIGELDHKDHLIRSFHPRLYFENKDAIVLTKSKYESPTFQSQMRYYAKEEATLRFVDSLTYQVWVYGVEELASLLNRAGWKVHGTYGSIETLQPLTPNSLMNIVAKAV